MRYARIISALALLCSFLLSCGPARKVERTTVSPGDAHALPADAPFLKSHMRDGSLYVLSRWHVGAIDSLVTGEGVHYGATREVISRGAFSVPLDSVVLLETNVVKSSSANAAFAALLIVTTAVAIVCISNPKSCFGSCPTFYAEDDPTVVQAESFSASVAPSLEETDVDALYRVRPGVDSLTLRLTNEANETHVVRRADLLAVPCPPHARAGRVSDGTFRLFRDPRPAVRADGEEGDLAPLLAAFDRAERFSPADSADLAARETVDLVFAPREGPTALVLAARQTLLTTYLYYQTLAYLGSGAGTWIAMLERSEGAGRPLAEGIGTVLGGIEILAPSKDGGWRRVDEVGETGPIATDVYLVPLPDAGGDSVRVRLRLVRGMWRLDYAALASLGAEVAPLRLAPIRVTREGRDDPAALRALTTHDHPLVTVRGDAYRITYALPPDPKRHEYFLEARGYYLEWMRREWLREEDAGRAGQAFLDPRGALRRMAPEFKRTEPEMESLFWSSRYATR
jgi:hypothetical protein